MSHVRQQIREAIASRLTGLASTGARVSATRVHPIGDGAGPSISIYTVEEESAALSMGTGTPGRTIERQLTIAIEVAIQAVDFDDLLDQSATEIELAMAQDITLGGLLHDCGLAATTVGPEADAATPTGIMRLEYLATYITQEGDPQLNR